jgi:hypothetical protein
MHHIAVVDGSGVEEAEQQHGASRGVLEEARCEMQRHDPQVGFLVPMVPLPRRPTHTVDAHASWLSAD